MLIITSTAWEREKNCLSLIDKFEKKDRFFFFLFLNIIRNLTSIVFFMELIFRYLLLFTIDPYLVQIEFVILTSVDIARDYCISKKKEKKNLYRRVRKIQVSN